MTQQLMKTAQKEFIFEQSAKSKEELLGNIFATLRKEAYSQIPGVILQMEPLEVYILEEKEEKTTEKFLWLFMPKERVSYTAKVKLVVVIKYIET